MELARPAEIEFRSVSKSFGPTKVLQGIDFSIQAGEIHALVGENGAGKSTLMKILFGLLTCDQGEIFIRGQKLNLASPSEARSLGIGMVHQHFMLAGALTALDHILIEMPGSKLSLIPRHEICADLTRFADELGLSIDWNAQIDELPVGLQQRLEILKLLYFKNEILILDEPTAVLTPQETHDFLDRLKHLRSLGKTIILITHKLKEVFAVADRISVLRHGRLIETKAVQDWTLPRLAESMIGEKTKTAEYQERPAELNRLSPIQVRTSDQIQFQMLAGEIVGIAGVEGNGQAELIQSLILPSSGPDNLAIRQSGVGYLAEDRHHKSIALPASVLENYMLGIQDLFSKWGWVDWKSLKTSLQESIETFSIRLSSIDSPIASLSGGNQQKLVVAREIQRKLRLLIAAQPTRGVDLGAIEQIHSAFFQLRHQGTSILLVSSDLEELMKLSDRILVLYKHQVVAEFSRAEFNEQKIGLAMGGAQ